MSTVDPLTLTYSMLEQGTAVPVTTVPVTTGTVTLYNSTVSNPGYLHEHLSRLEFGDDEEKCGACPKALECASGGLRLQQFVAKSRVEHLEGYTLPCIDDGKVRLAIIDDATADYEINVMQPELTTAISGASPGISFTTDSNTGFYTDNKSLMFVSSGVSKAVLFPSGNVKAP